MATEISPRDLGLRDAIRAAVAKARSQGMSARGIIRRLEREADKLRKGRREAGRRWG